MEWLPIGSVVALAGGTKRLMISGRAQRHAESGERWDYMGVPFPEGNVSADYTFFFNHDQIERVDFRGCEDGEELVFREMLAERIAALGTEGDSDADPAEPPNEG